MAINQAVLFSKPLHHLDISFTSDELNYEIQQYLKSNEIYIRLNKKINGKNLESKNILNNHYRIYDYATNIDSILNLEISDISIKFFEEKFSVKWNAAIDTNKLDTVNNIKKRYNLSNKEISDIWNDDKNDKVIKLQPGLVVSYIKTLDIFLINGFYPYMIELFYNHFYDMNYYVVEFDSKKINWINFRKDILGATNCSKSLKTSFRGLMYSKFKVTNPGTNNFIHGSAGPLEGLIERIVHEQSLALSTNPIGVYLLSRNMQINQFNLWLDNQSIDNLSWIFDETEEKNSDQIQDFLNETLFI